MKRYILISVFLFSFFMLSFSQFHIGIRGGINTNYFKENETTVDNLRIIVPKDQTMGFHFGVVTQLQVSDFFVQPELNFSSNRNDIIIVNLNPLNPVEELENHRFNKLNLPLMVGYKFNSFKLQLGPVGSVLISSKADLLEDRNIKQNLKSLMYGYQAGIGLDIGKLALDLKYEGNLSRLGDGLTIGGNDVKFDQRANQIIFSVGLFIR
jgi:hypothetical protein